MSFKEKIANYILAHRKTLIYINILFFALSLFLMTRVKMDTSLETFVLKGDVARVYYDSFTEEFGSDLYNILAFEYEDVFSNRCLEIIQGITQEIEDVEGVAEVISLSNVNDIAGRDEGFVIEPLIEELPLSKEQLKKAKENALNNPLYLKDLISDDGKTVSIVTKLEVDSDSSKPYYASGKTISEIKDIISNYEKRYGQRFYFSGPEVLSYYNGIYMQKDLQIFIPVVLALVAVVLFLIFQNIWCVLILNLIILFSLVDSMSVFYFLNATMNNATTVVPPLVLVLSVADSIHLLTTYKIEGKRTNDSLGALRQTIIKNLTPCFLSSLTTALGFFAFSSSQVPPVRSFGLVSSVTMMLIFLITMTLIPPVLSLSGFKKLAPGGTPSFEGFLNRCSTRIYRFSTRFSQGILIYSSLIVIPLFIFGVTRLQLNTNFLEMFKKGTICYRHTKFIEERLAPVRFLELSLKANERDYFKKPEVLKRIENLEDFLIKEFDSSKVNSILLHIREMHKSFHNENQEFYKVPYSKRLISQYFLLYDFSEIDHLINSEFDWTRVSARISEYNSSKTKEIIAKVEQYLKSIFPDIETKVTGDLSLENRLVETFQQSQFSSIFLAFLTIFGVMFLAFRSFKYGVLSLIPNIFPLLLNYAIMGIFKIDLNVSTIMITAIILGIIVDDTIHFIVKFKSEFKKDRDVKEIIRVVFEEKSIAIITTSVIIFFGFAVLVLSSYFPTMSFGLLASIAMVTALIGDLVVLPAAIIAVRGWLK